METAAAKMNAKQAAAYATILAAGPAGITAPKNKIPGINHNIVNSLTRMGLVTCSVNGAFVYTAVAALEVETASVTGEEKIAAALSRGWKIVAESTRIGVRRAIMSRAA